MNLSNEAISLKNVLHKTTPDERTVVYFGVCEVMVSKIISTNDFDKKDYDATMRMKIKRYIDVVGELAIIDRSLLESIATKILKFKLYKPTIEELYNKLYTIEDFNDTTGLNTFYGKIEIETINTNIPLYKEAIGAMYRVINHISENVENY